MSEDNYNKKGGIHSAKGRKNSMLTNNQNAKNSFDQYLSVGNLKKSNNAISKRNMHYSTNVTSKSNQEYSGKDHGHEDDDSNGFSNLHDLNKNHIVNG